ncbi:hypothetical protein [Prochlorococcus marinus]|uniref:hypothetical protein n=1 Tax=Prochlorococcus marinus TaxID=1219 RepID=UPI00214AB567|nr:hypothetical protein [Prochlorococcus marinus]
MIRFTENKNYIQGIFYTNKSRISKTYPTTLESQSAESIKTISTDYFEIHALDNTDDNTLVKEVQLTSE